MDHAPLQWLSWAKMDNARIMRWTLVLQLFKLQIMHHAGKANTAADFLSRYGSGTQSPGTEGDLKETKGSSGRNLEHAEQASQGNLRRGMCHGAMREEGWRPLSWGWNSIRKSCGPRETAQKAP